MPFVCISNNFHRRAAAVPRRTKCVNEFHFPPPIFIDNIWFYSFIFLFHLLLFALLNKQQPKDMQVWAIRNGWVLSGSLAPRGQYGMSAELKKKPAERLLVNFSCKFVIAWHSHICQMCLHKLFVNKNYPKKRWNGRRKRGERKKWMANGKKREREKEFY